MSDEQPIIPAVAKYDPVFARLEAERTKLRQAAMAKWIESEQRFIYGAEAVKERIKQGLYVVPECWKQGWRDDRC